MIGLNNYRACTGSVVRYHVIFRHPHCIRDEPPVCLQLISISPNFFLLSSCGGRVHTTRDGIFMFSVGSSHIGLAISESAAGIIWKLSSR